MTAPTNRMKADRYLTDICGYLISQGLLVAPRAYRRSAEDHEYSEIRGLDEFCIRLNRSYKMDLSGSMDDLKRDTADDGREFGALVQFRSARGAPEQYVVVSLEDFAGIAKRLEAVS